MKSLDAHDKIPDAMRNYLSHYGFHFSKKAFEYACEGMAVMSKEKVESLQEQYGVNIANDVLYDKAYVATMAKSDFALSLDSETRIVRFVKEYLDDKDGCGEEAFRRWVADRIGRGKPIDWDSIL